ncbi:MAG: flagellar protein FlgN [Bacillota bacterium]
MGQDVQRASTFDLVQQLAEVLERHCEAYEDLCALLSSEREALKDNDIDDLHTLLLGQEGVIMRIARDEEVRMKIQCELAEILDLDPEASLVELLERTEIASFHRRRLDRARARMLELAQRAGSINEDNRDLVHQALKFIAYSLDEVRVLAGGGITYDKGSSGDRSDALLMDEKY